MSYVDIETGQVTGTKDKDYDIIWFTEQCLSNALRLETYVQDADRIGGLRAGRVLPPGAGREPKGCRAGQAAAASTTVQLTNQSPSSAQRARSPICGTCSEADSAPHPRSAPACVASIDRVPVRLVFLAIKRRRPERQRQHDEHHSDNPVETTFLVISPSDESGEGTLRKQRYSSRSGFVSGPKPLQR